MTFLFDIGRVLLDFDFESSMSQLFPAGISGPEQRMNLLLERKDEFETGKIAVDTYITWRSKSSAAPPPIKNSQLLGSKFSRLTKQCGAASASSPPLATV